MGKPEREEKVFYIHWDIYLLAGDADKTCNSGRDVGLLMVRQCALRNCFADRLYFSSSGRNLGCGRRRILYCIGSLFVLCSRGQVEAYTVLYSILRNISVDVRRRYPVSDNESIFFLGLS